MVDPSRHTHKSYVNYADRVLNALEKVVGFFAQSYQDINLDGVFGLRVAEGKLSFPDVWYEQNEIYHKWYIN